MATGKEIKRLRGRKSAAEIADLIGVGVDKLRKWEERDTDPKDTGDIQKVEQYFGCQLKDLSGLSSFDFVKNPSKMDFRDKYIASLEARIADKEAQLKAYADINSAMADIRAGVKYNNSMLRALRVSAAAVESKVTKAPLRTILDRIGKDALSHYERALEMDSWHDSDK